MIKILCARSGNPHLAPSADHTGLFAPPRPCFAFNTVHSTRRAADARRSGSQPNRSGSRGRPPCHLPATHTRTGRAHLHHRPTRACRDRDRTRAPASARDTAYPNASIHAERAALPPDTDSTWQQRRSGQSTPKRHSILTIVSNCVPFRPVDSIPRLTL
jgi:hypothetical protein